MELQTTIGAKIVLVSWKDVSRRAARDTFKYSKDNSIFVKEIN